MIPDRVMADLTRPARAVILVDGGSGAGKSRLTAELVARWPGRRPTLVAMDALYPGWNGLAAGSDAVLTDILHSQEPGYRRWNWAAGRPGNWVRLPAEESLIIEGCGALTPRNREAATSGIWVAAEPAVRHARIEERDPPTYAPYRATWDAQERAHWRRHHPRQRADWIVTGDHWRQQQTQG